MTCGRGLSGDAAFTDDDLKLLEALSSPAAAALANALLHEQVRRAWAVESRLLEVSSEISKEISLHALLTKIVSTAVMVVGAERVTLFVQDPKTSELWTLTGAGDGGQEVGSPSHPRDRGAGVPPTGNPGQRGGSARRQSLRQRARTAFRDADA